MLALNKNIKSNTVLPWTAFFTLGPCIYLKDAKAGRMINDYQKKINSGDKVSLKVDPYFDPDVMALVTEQDSFEAQLKRRSLNGYKVVCHVFAYMSGFETLFNEHYLEERKRAANMICREFGYDEMYKLDEPDNLDISDYGVDGPVLRPIITQNIITEAQNTIYQLTLASEKPDEGPELADILDGIRALAEGAVKIDDADVEVIEPERNKVVADGEVVDAELVMEVVDPASVVSPPEDEPEPDIKPLVGNVVEDENIVTPLESPDISQAEKPSPVSFNFNEMDLNKDVALVPVTTGQKKHFSSAFGEYITNGATYQLNRIPAGAIECVIREIDGSFRTYWIDPNLCCGNGYYVMGTIETGDPEHPLDTIPVHQSEETILKKVFKDKKYVLTPNEVERCKAHLFNNMKIYAVYDMSTMSTRLSKMSEEGLANFEKKLTYIIDNLPTEMLGRFRFRDWKNDHEFGLVSDLKCKSPFPGETLETVTGVSILVKDNEITVIPSDINTNPDSKSILLNFAAA